MTTTPADFSALSFPSHLLVNRQQLGFLQMTQDHAASLRMALPGKDLIVQAQNGSGKTAAFALRLLANFNARRFAVQAVVQKR